MTTGRINQVAAPVGRVAPPWRDSSLGRARASRPNPSFSKILNSERGATRKRDKSRRPGHRPTSPAEVQNQELRGLCTVFRKCKGFPQDIQLQSAAEKGPGPSSARACPLLFQLLSSFFNFRRSLLDNRPGRGPQRARSECVSVRLSGASRFPYTFFSREVGFASLGRKDLPGVTAVSPQATGVFL